MLATTDTELLTRNPATGEPVGRAAVADPASVVRVVAEARDAQCTWEGTPIRDRLAFLDRWRRIISRDAAAWSSLIRREIGKPEGEALAGDVIPTLDGIRWTIKNASRVLADERAGASWQRFLLIPSGEVRRRPLGVVGMIGTWNYPLFLNAGPIAQALAAGNAVVWKPSEFAVAVGERIRDSLAEAGFPDGIVGTVQGGAETGRALVEADIDKVVFTGGVESGRHVLAAAAARGVPGVAELSGFDPAVILPDAPLESTVRSLVWASFVGCGQTCVAVKRAYVVGDVGPWLRVFADRVRELRVGDPSRPDVDVGPMIHERARDRFAATIRATVAAGAEVIEGGRPREGEGCFYEPTLLHATSDAAERALEGVFGPVLLVQGVPDEDAAVEAANRASMALGASVWGRDLRRARDVGRRLVAGSVSINDAVTPTASASAPFGGFKASGYGRTHGAEGVREFVASQAYFERRAGGFRPQLFPYGASASVARFLGFYRRWFHPPA